MCRIQFSQEDKLLQSFTEQYFIVNKLFWENWVEFKIQNLPIQLYSESVLHIWCLYCTNSPTVHDCVEKLSMIISCNIWIICLELNWFVYDPSWMLQLSDFVWTLRSSVWVVLNHFLLIEEEIEVRLVAIKSAYLWP